tara:strand:+ start:762 stop:1136 length:375 start_codon:yes stop_codon:yes gene_type:complete
MNTKQMNELVVMIEERCPSSLALVGYGCSDSHVFDSGWEYSVVPWGMGAEDGLLEIAIKKDGEWCDVNETPIGGEMGYLTILDVAMIVSSMSTWESDEDFDDMKKHALLYAYLDSINDRWEEEE